MNKENRINKVTLNHFVDVNKNEKFNLVMGKRKMQIGRDLVLTLEPEYYNLPRKKKKYAKKIITLMVLEVIIEYVEASECKLNKENKDG